MTETSHQTVELRLAEAGSELVPAIEAAQYARIIDHDDPRTPAEAEAIAGFLEAFAGAAEDWEQLDQAASGTWLARLGDRLEALEAAGLHVHAGTLRRRVAVAGGGVVPLPMAVLTIGRSPSPIRQVLLPAELAVEDLPPLH